MRLIDPDAILHFQVFYSSKVAWRRPWAVWPILLLIPAPIGFGSTGSTTQTLNAALAPDITLTAPSSLALAAGTTPFTTYQGSEQLTFKVRTTPTGTGSITMRVTSDFSPSGGPAAAAGGLTYSCGTSYGSACKPHRYRLKPPC